MKFTFRGNEVFEYIPEKKEVILGNYVHGYPDFTPTKDPAYNMCCFIPEDYKIMSEFFDKVYRHMQGEEVVLEDIDVY